MDYVKAFVLGVLEGLTEFIPVSSTGHLIVAASLLNFSDETWKVFTIFIQLGAISAICFRFKGELLTVIKGIGNQPSANRFVINISLAFIPSVILGLLFYKIIKNFLFSPVTVAVALLIGGLIILWVEKQKFQPKTKNMDSVSLKQSLQIGLCQCIAMCPGVSRSGATIIGSMFFGLSRSVATQFSFYLAIPTMLAATVYDFYKNWELLKTANLDLFIIGFMTSFLAALVTVKLFLAFVSKHSFVVFGWYRIMMGSLLLILWQFDYFQGLPIWN